MDENIEKWPQSETGYQTSAFTLRIELQFYGIFLISMIFQ